jgi:endonuclease/exonuclease/phosphatase family metal-dependent hydrolase
MKIVTFNVRCSWSSDGINSFIHRAGMIYEKIREEAPDVVAFQEIREKHLALLERMMPEYTFCGQLRNADYGGEGLYTAIRTDRLQVLGMETFWLSPTPYVAGSRYEHQSDCPRICVMTQVRNKKSGQILRIYNLHLDHKDEEARVLGMKSVLDYVTAQNQKTELPAVILGDFNAKPNSEAIALCRAYEGGLLTDLTEEIPSTFHNFGRMTTDCKIDYIFVSPTLAEACTGVTVWADVHDGIYLSDHYPVSAEFSE